jgi:deoxyribodipyrimidine photolyase
MRPTVDLFWFRRDLRLNDNAGLYHALKNGNPVVPVFIFDKNILDELEDRVDRRVEFIHLAIERLQQQLNRAGSTLDVRYGYPADVFRQLLSDYTIEKVFTNHDYEPYGKARDADIKTLLAKSGAHDHGFFSYQTPAGGLEMGEAYFAKKLLDFDLASNNGGWQWAAGSGCDAAPYFRIFNPYLQTKKFDPELKYIRKWVPEFEEFTYPPPIVEHAFARKRCLEAYAKALKK